MSKLIKNKRLVCLLLAGALALTGALHGRTDSSIVLAKKNSSGYIDTSDLEDQKKDAQKKIKDLKKNIENAKQKIKDLESSASSLQSYISELDQQANELSSQINELNAQIEEKQAEIEQTQAEYEEAVATADKQYEDMKKRIQYLYESGSPSYLELLLTAENMTDFLNRSSYASELTEYDRNMLEEYIAQKEAVAAKEAELTAEKEELDEMAKTAQEQKDTVDQLIETKTAQLAQYQAEIAAQTSNAEAYADDLDEQEALLEKIESQIAAAAAANALLDDGDGGASGFMWPCPASHTISSGYGPRSRPTAGASTNHKGIDIAASSGSAIVAAAGGRVTTATYSSSAGNYVVVSHGNGISTVYMHCSALYVSVGDKVSKGQTIAAVGSTGYSTGSHLHFGVIKNGSYVNPLGYVS